MVCATIIYGQQLLCALSLTHSRTHDLRRVYGNFCDAVLKSLLIVLGNNRKDEEAQTNS